MRQGRYEWREDESEAIARWVTLRVLLPLLFLGALLLGGCASVEERLAGRATKYIEAYCALSPVEREAAQAQIDNATAPYVLRLQTCEVGQ